MTEKQIFFCEEYLKDFNATQAAIRAGYSQQSAYSIGSENLKKPEIHSYIEARKSERKKQSFISLETLLADLIHIKNKCIYENFDARAGINACNAIKDFLLLYEEKTQEYVKKLSTEELENQAAFYLSPEVCIKKV